MAATARPGSVTLFAVLNFILAGLGCLGLLGQLALLVMQHGGMPDVPGGHEALAAIPTWWMWTALGGGVLKVGLLVASGFGLLRLSVPWGRWAATAAAVICLALVVGEHLAVGHRGSGDSEAPLRLLALAMGALYPLLLLLWINGVVVDVWRPPRAAAPGGDAPAHPFALTVAQSLRQSLRSASGPGFTFSLVLAGLLCCAGLLMATVLSTQLGESTGLAASPGQRSELLERGTAGILGFILREPAADDVEVAAVPAAEPTSAVWARHLVRAHPAGLSFAWLLLAMVLPPLVLFAACGQIARDVGNRGFRFLLTRIDRDSIFLGRASAAALFTTAVVLLTVATCTVVMGLAEPQPQWGAILAWGAWAALALVLASLPFVALGMLCSTLVGHPFAALSLAQGVVIGCPLAAFLLARVWDPLGYSVHLLPLAVQFGLFHPSPWVVAGAALACLAYTAAYLWLGLRHFRRRDL